MLRPVHPSLEAVRDLVIRELRAQGVPSLAVAVARDGEILWEEGFGWADRARRVPADEHTTYSLASITKAMTGTALMQQVEKDAVDLDAPIERYLGGARLQPRAVTTAEGATVRRVANHTAGLPLHYQFFYEDEPYLRPPMAETMRRYALLVTAPGERMQYSNLGYGILDHLLSAVTGTPYADLVRRDVFVPLGMHRSAIGLPADLAPLAAQRYGSDDVAYPPYDFDHPGGSAAYASAHDLLRFGMAMLRTPLPDQRSVLADASIGAMHADAGGKGYGVGWIVAEESGYATVGHSGGMGGVSTQLLLVPSERIAVVALTNRSSALLAAMTRIAVLDALLPGYDGEAVGSTLLAQAAPQGEEPSDEVWASMAGRWDGEVEVFSGNVRLSLDVRPAERLVLARLGRAPRVVVDRLRVVDGRLQGGMLGDLRSPDTARYRHGLVTDLVVRGDVIDGALVAVALPGTEDEGGAPGRRAGNALAHWVSLGRVR